MAWCFRVIVVYANKDNTCRDWKKVPELAQGKPERRQFRETQSIWVSCHAFAPNIESVFGKGISRTDWRYIIASDDSPAPPSPYVASDNKNWQNSNSVQLFRNDEFISCLTITFHVNLHLS
jgi:hypothetical protein